MFTGIVEALGSVLAIELAAAGADARLKVRAPQVLDDVHPGDSIAVSGICLTVVSSDGEAFEAEMMAETLRATTAGTWTPGQVVNLERSVRADTRLGGHVVQGHVDGVGTLIARTPHQGYDEIRIAVGTDIARYVARKGAVAVDGISLTVVDVQDTGSGAEFSVGIIPTTRTATSLGTAAAGDPVNIEVDVMAKYVERLLPFQPGYAAGAVPPDREARQAQGTPRDPQTEPIGSPRPDLQGVR